MCLLMLLNTKGITPGCNVGSTSNCATQYCQAMVCDAILAFNALVDRCMKSCVSERRNVSTKYI